MHPSENVIDGLVITFIDITKQKRTDQVPRSDTRMEERPPEENTMKEARDPDRVPAEQTRPLRQRAEERLRTTRSEIQRMSPEEVQQLVHELQVSQIELQLQNEELYRAQQELTATRDRYSDLYDFAPVGYVTLSPEGVILEANLTAATLLGTERSDLVGTLLSRFISADARDTFRQHLHRLRTELCTCEVAVQRSSGQPMTLKLESVAVEEAHGTPRQFRTILSDISARKQAEEALRQSEERFRALIEHSADVFMILGPDGTIHYRSPTRTGRGLYEYQIEELIGKNAFDLVHPEDRPRMQAFLAETVQRPGPSPLAYLRARHSDGSWRVMEAVLNNQLANPAIAGIIYTGRDVTERKQAEEALRALNETLEQRVAERIHALQESEERYRDLFDNASDMIATLTLDEVVTSINRAFSQCLGYAREDIVGRSWRQFATPASATLVNERIRRVVVKEDVPSVFEIELLHKDGKAVPVEARVRFIHNQTKVPIGLHTICRDIAQRRAVDRLKDELISTVNHELRTPLTSLRGFSELLLTRDFSPQQQRNMVSIIHQESTRLTTLINDFLDLQHIAEGRQPYTFEPVDLEPLLREATAVFSAEQGQHPFQFAIQAPLPLVHADPNRVCQVLSNLLSNAIKYTPDGGTVSVGARLEGEEVLVWITDRGIGIPPEALPHLFTKFFRVNNASTRHIGGTGLGLALVKEIINAHHGRVWAESTLGKGSTFFFTIPPASQVTMSANIG